MPLYYRDDHFGRCGPGCYAHYKPQSGDLSLVPLPFPPKPPGPTQQDVHDLLRRMERTEQEQVEAICSALGVPKNLLDMQTDDFQAHLSTSSLPDEHITAASVVKAHAEASGA